MAAAAPSHPSNPVVFFDITIGGQVRYSSHFNSLTLSYLRYLTCFSFIGSWKDEDGALC